MPADTEITEGCHGLLSSRFLITYRGNQIGNTALHGRLVIHQTQGTVGVANQGRQDEDFFQQLPVLTFLHLQQNRGDIERAT